MTTFIAVVVLGLVLLAGLIVGVVLWVAIRSRSIDRVIER